MQESRQKSSKNQDLIRKTKNAATAGKDKTLNHDRTPPPPFFFILKGFCNKTKKNLQ